MNAPPCAPRRGRAAILDHAGEGTAATVCRRDDGVSRSESGVHRGDRGMSAIQASAGAWY